MACVNSGEAASGMVKSKRFHIRRNWVCVLTAPKILFQFPGTWLSEEKGLLHVIADFFILLVDGA